eukprot:EG_transcript_6741
MPLTLQRLARYGIESMLFIPAAQKDSPQSSLNPGQTCRPEGGRADNSPLTWTPPLGPADPIPHRCWSEGSGSSSGSGSGGGSGGGGGGSGSPASLSYMHSPYTFGGPTFFPPSPSAEGCPWSPTRRDVTDLEVAAAEPSLIFLGGAVHRGGCSPAPGLLPLLPPPLDAPPTPQSSQPSHTPGMLPSQAPVPHPHATLQGSRCPCATCASSPPSPSCDHPRPWRRLRAKRGFTFYACRDCGAKWRTVTPSRLEALTAGRDA